MRTYNKLSSVCVPGNGGFSRAGDDGIWMDLVKFSQWEAFLCEGSLTKLLASYKRFPSKNWWMVRVSLLFQENRLLPPKRAQDSGINQDGSSHPKFGESLVLSSSPNGRNKSWSWIGVTVDFPTGSKKNPPQVFPVKPRQWQWHETSGSECNHVPWGWKKIWYDGLVTTSVNDEGLMTPPYFWYGFGLRRKGKPRKIHPIISLFQPSRRLPRFWTWSKKGRKMVAQGTSFIATNKKTKPTSRLASGCFLLRALGGNSRQIVFFSLQCAKPYINHLAKF